MKEDKTLRLREALSRAIITDPYINSILESKVKLMQRSIPSIIICDGVEYLYDKETTRALSKMDEFIEERREQIKKSFNTNSPATPGL